MADHQRIHPVHDPEAPKPTAPLVSRDASKSEQGDPIEHYPPFARTIPLTQEKPPKKRRGCCARCFCCTLCIILLLIIILGALTAVVYFVYHPKIPKYSVDSMRITQFNLNNDMSLYATFNVNITARNPNKRIGIYYRGGSHISVWYTGTKLCEGSWPKFYQGHKNTTVLDLPLTGQSSNATDILTSLQAAQQSGSIPLTLRAKVPVRIKLGSLKLMKWKFSVKCKIIVDSLAANNVVSISDKSCKFRFKL